MKKFLILTLFTLACFIGNAQVNTMTSAAYPANVIDTVTNTATKYLVSGRLGKGATVTVQFTATEISGTTAGTATLQGSLDNSNWYTIGSAYTLTDVAAQTTAFKVTTPNEVYLRVAVTGSGTMSDQIKAKYLLRQ